MIEITQAVSAALRSLWLPVGCWLQCKHAVLDRRLVPELCPSSMFVAIHLNSRRLSVTVAYSRGIVVMRARIWLNKRCVGEGDDLVRLLHLRLNVCPTTSSPTDASLDTSIPGINGACSLEAVPNRFSFGICLQLVACTPYNPRIFPYSANFGLSLHRTRLLTFTRPFSDPLSPPPTITLAADTRPYAQRPPHPPTCLGEDQVQDCAWFLWGRKGHHRGRAPPAPFF